ncbi:zf-HC2 domain-containing protein [Streptomyces sp. NPDC058632]|uniref:zf-HC2 domain-containing protein n=1 Tax=unclassified Streptomyces TaxID=2593676 RepID=UPI0036659D34
MSVEHASARLIRHYARGDAGIAADEVWALEAHLEVCGHCRERLGAAVSTEAPAITSLLETVRSALEPRLDTVAAMPPRRWRRVRWSSWMTPAMAPWLAMTVGLTLMALLLDVAAPDFGEVSLLLLAPVLPLAGVAASWSRALDPAHELTVSTPRAGLYLLLRRTVSVLVVVLPVLLAAGRLTGAMTAAQWLLPSLAFTSTALALGSVIDVTRAAAALMAVWGVVVAPAWATGRVPVLLQPDRLPTWGLLLVLGLGVVIARRSAYSVSRNPR